MRFESQYHPKTSGRACVSMGRYELGPSEGHEALSARLRGLGLLAECPP